MKSIVNAQIVNEGRTFKGSLKIDGAVIAEVAPEGSPFEPEGEIIDAAGRYVIPGVIDEHVHFRDPGLTQKADIASESRAAAVGGVTSFFDMPNTKPQTTSLNDLADKMKLGEAKSLVNYAFYIGATNDNMVELEGVDASLVPGIKVFMGASTGNMLVEDAKTLDGIFQLAHNRNLPLVAHCEDTSQIMCNEAAVKASVGDNAGVEYHPIIRNAKECLDSTHKALDLAMSSGAQLLVAHVSTGEEIEEISRCSGNNVKAEVCVAYLCFNDDDYAKLGARIKCNPAIKSAEQQSALTAALRDGKVFTIATDHAPHLISDKCGGVFSATSGVPSVQFSLPLMLQLTENGATDIEQVVELMCHNPARFFGVRHRGFIREGYKADLVMLERMAEPYAISDADVVSKCGWTPYAGRKLNWRVAATMCNGTLVYRHGEGFTSPAYRGEAIEFNHDDNTTL